MTDYCMHVGTHDRASNNQIIVVKHSRRRVWEDIIIDGLQFWCDRRGRFMMQTLSLFLSLTTTGVWNTSQYYTKSM